MWLAENGVDATAVDGLGLTPSTTVAVKGRDSLVHRGLARRLHAIGAAPVPQWSPSLERVPWERFNPLAALVRAADVPEAQKQVRTVSLFFK